MEDEDGLRRRLEAEQHARQQAEAGARAAEARIQDIGRLLSGFLDRMGDNYLDLDVLREALATARNGEATGAEAVGQVGSGEAGGGTPDATGAGAADAADAVVAPPAALSEEFVRDARHAVQGTLGVVLGFLELLRSGRLPAGSDRDEALRDTHRTVRQMDILLQELFEALELRAGPTLPERLAIGPEVEGAVAEHRAAAQDRSVRLRTDIDPSLGVVRLDRARLHHALDLTLDHIFLAAPAESDVDVRAVVEGGAVRLEIEYEDPRAERRSIDRALRFFDPDGRPALARARLLVEANGGRADISMGAERRVRLRLTWPRSLHQGLPAPAPPARPAATEVAGQQEREEPRPQPKGPRILVVEDNEEERHHLRDALESSGYRVITASTVDEAILEGCSTRFDAITLDLLLGREFSLQVLAAVRTEGPNKETPVLVLSVASPGNVAFPYAVQGHLQKPFSKRTLLRALRWIRVPPALPGPVLLIAPDPGPARLREAVRRTGRRLVQALDVEGAVRGIEDDAPDLLVVDPSLEGLDETFYEGVDAPVLFWGGERPEGHASGSIPKDAGVDDMEAVLAAALDANIVEEGEQTR